MKFPVGSGCFLKKNVDGLYAGQYVTIVRSKYKNKKRFPKRAKWIVDVQDANGNLVRAVPYKCLRR